jgi:hypothetical protein
MKTMWIDTEVEALVEYKSALAYPLVRAIRWNGRRIDFESRPRVERSNLALLYHFDEGSTSHALRFEIGRQRWFLEGFDDSGVTDWPPLRVFPPTNRKP